LSYTATYLPGHKWLVSTATLVKPVTLILVPVFSLSVNDK
jgi:hypothetical protein